MMMAASSAAAFYGMREEDDQRQMKQQHSSTPSSSTAPPAPPQKKRRNQPNPDAEVIALSPKTLMATNRFICEVCNKGFQREQNLQLHRRGHNLPWKLRQKSTKDGEDQVVKKKVYLCPEPTCVHHDPSRPLGDLTGIKKHYSRKHGEKKYKCDKCSKKYAVHSDWKAHSKTCGTREYRCDCGTLFSRRDSFITHRAFCDALAQESARHDQPTLSTIGSHLYGSSASNMNSGLSQMGQEIFSIQDDENQPAIDILRLGGDRTGEFGTMIAPTNNNGSAFRPTQSMPASSSVFFNMPESNQDYHEDQNQTQHANKQYHGLMLQLPDLQNNTNNPSTAANIFNLSFLSNISSNVDSMDNSSNANANANANSNLYSSLSLLFPNQFNGTGHASEGSSTQFSGNIMGTQITSGIPSLYSSPLQNNNNINVANSQMSATALLQKAAQMDSTTSNNISSTASLLKGYRKSDTAPVAANFGGENNKNHLHHDLMNSLAGGSQLSTIFGNAYGGHEQENTTYGGYINANRSGLEQPPQHYHSPSLSNYMDQPPKVHHNINQSVGVGGFDRLTRDFLGIRETVSSGYSQRDQQHGINDMSSLDSERKTAPKSQSFGDGSFQ